MKKEIILKNLMEGERKSDRKDSKKIIGGCSRIYLSNFTFITKGFLPASSSACIACPQNLQFSEENTTMSLETTILLTVSAALASPEEKVLLAWALKTARLLRCIDESIMFFLYMNDRIVLFVNL